MWGASLPSSPTPQPSSGEGQNRWDQVPTVYFSIKSKVQRRGEGGWVWSSSTGQGPGRGSRPRCKQASEALPVWRGGALQGEGRGAGEARWRPGRVTQSQASWMSGGSWGSSASHCSAGTLGSKGLCPLTGPVLPSWAGLSPLSSPLQMQEVSTAPGSCQRPSSALALCLGRPPGQSLGGEAGDWDGGRSGLECLNPMTCESISESPLGTIIKECPPRRAARRIQ